MTCRDLQMVLGTLHTYDGLPGGSEVHWFHPGNDENWIGGTLLYPKMSPIQVISFFLRNPWRKKNNLVRPGVPSWPRSSAVYFNMFFFVVLNLLRWLWYKSQKLPIASLHLRNSIVAYCSAWDLTWGITGLGGKTSSSWWFGTCFTVFLHMLGRIIPTD